MKNRYLYFCLSLFISLFMNNLYAQQWVNYNSNNVGLPSNRIYSINFDSDDNVWIASYGVYSSGGLSYFDKSEWVHYTFENSGLPTNEIIELSIDNQDNVWMATAIGLVKFDKTDFITYNTDNSELRNNYILSVCFDSENNLWISSFGSIARFDGTNWTFYDYLLSDMEWKFAGKIVSYENEIWISIAGGILKYVDGQWTKYDEENATFIGADEGTTAAIGNNGDVWVRYTGEFHKYSRLTDTWEMVSVPGTDYYCNSDALMLDQNGTVWYGANGGLAKIINGEFSLYNTSNSGIAGDYLNTLSDDTDGKIWIGTSNYGISIFDPSFVSSVRDNKSSLPATFKLSQNYPNPFNPSTNIQYSIPEDGNVKLTIYDIVGNEIETIVNEFEFAGNYKINYINVNLASGVYIYKMVSGKFSDAKKMIFIK